MKWRFAFWIGVGFLSRVHVDDDDWLLHSDVGMKLLVQSGHP